MRHEMQQSMIDLQRSLKALAQAKGITQSELAASAGVNTYVINSFMNGKEVRSISWFVDILLELDIDLNKLLEKSLKTASKKDRLRKSVERDVEKFTSLMTQIDSTSRKSLMTMVDAMSDNARHFSNT